MALTPARWLMAAIVGCALLTTGMASSARRASPRDIGSPEQQHFVRLQRRTMDAAQQLRSLTRRDSILAVLATRGRVSEPSVRLVTDPLLPPAHRLLIERGVERQRRLLHIDSIHVPVSIVVVIDTAVVPREIPGSRRGELAFEYVLAEGAAGTRSECVAILAIQSPVLARPGGNRRFAEHLDPSRRAEALLGPCAFQARFGVAGAQIDAWLRSRSYDLALDASWEEPGRDLGPQAAALRDEARAESWRYTQWDLSIPARACAAGEVKGCEDAMTPAHGTRRQLPSGAMVRRSMPWDTHWGARATDYLSDLVTAIGPERFARFWRSDLPPDAALRSAAAMPLSGWTQQWIGELAGPARFGPGLAAREILTAVLVAALCLTVAAWGFGRRQVR